MSSCRILVVQWPVPLRLWGFLLWFGRSAELVFAQAAPAAAQRATQAGPRSPSLVLLLQPVPLRLLPAGLAAYHHTWGQWALDGLHPQAAFAGLPCQWL